MLSVLNTYTCWHSHGKQKVGLGKKKFLWHVHYEMHYVYHCDRNIQQQNNVIIFREIYEIKLIMVIENSNLKAFDVFIYFLL